jgi:hypothetical protein
LRNAIANWPRASFMVATSRFAIMHRAEDSHGHRKNGHR